MKAHKKKISCTASIQVVSAIARFYSGSYEPAVVKRMGEKQIRPARAGFVDGANAIPGNALILSYPSLILNLAAGAMNNQETNPL